MGYLSFTAPLRAAALAAPVARNSKPERELLPDFHALISGTEARL